jgi:hypothetical protein
MSRRGTNCSSHLSLPMRCSVFKSYINTSLCADPANNRFLSNCKHSTEKKMRWAQVHGESMTPLMVPPPRLPTRVATHCLVCRSHNYNQNEVSMLDTIVYVMFVAVMNYWYRWCTSLIKWFGVTMYLDCLVFGAGGASIQFSIYLDDIYSSSKFEWTLYFPEILCLHNHLPVANQSRNRNAGSASTSHWLWLWLMWSCPAMLNLVFSGVLRLDRHSPVWLWYRIHWLGLPTILKCRQPQRIISSCNNIWLMIEM